MRDIRYKTESRGGTLTAENHQLLMGWAIKCTEHVYKTLNKPIPSELGQALVVAKLWQQGIAKTGEAMKVAREVHKIVREYDNPIDIAAGRAVGHAVATAHMADHCMGPCLYGLKAIKLAGIPIDAEREWQLQQLGELPNDIVDLITKTLVIKSKGFKL